MNKLNFSFVLTVIGMLLVTAGCQKDVVISDEMIVFKQSDDFVLDVTTKAPETKASVVDESSLNGSGFYVSCTTGSAGSEVQQWNNVLFSKVGTYFVGPGDGKWWPSSNPSYHFMAANSAITFNAGGCTVAATNATDVVCAYLPNPTYKEPNTLSFEHVFARIGNVTFSAASGYTISDITVNITPKTGGTYNIRTGAGQTDGTGWSALTTGSATNIANATPSTKSNDLYLVPGRYTLSASWTATRGAYTKVFTNKCVDVDIVGGKINAITATLTGDASAVMFSVTVSAWTNNNIAIGTYPYAEFSVDAGTTVQFAPGNLQAVIGSGPTNTYNYSASSWKFADHQYDCIGNASGNNSFAVGTTVDLFGWVGESASWNTYGLCTNTSSNNVYYGAGQSEALKTDWGSIPGIDLFIGSGWRTLTTAEWIYLFSTRANASSLFGNCQITTASGTVTGRLILPDNWTKPSNCTVIPGNGSFTQVTYSATASSGATNAWCDMEAAGAVFLPAAGYRSGTSVSNVGSYAFYWSSSYYGSTAASAFMFYGGVMNVRNMGFSVRLVR